MGGGKTNEDGADGLLRVFGHRLDKVVLEIFDRLTLVRQCLVVLNYCWAAKDAEVSNLGTMAECKLQGEEGVPSGRLTPLVGCVLRIAMA